MDGQDRTQQTLAVDGGQRGEGVPVMRALEAIERLDECRVGGRGDDLALRHADHAHAQAAALGALRRVARQRVRAERRRHRRIGGVEAVVVGRVGGDEGVDEAQRGRGLAARPVHE
jgi:hypothetical protein